jgi:hypothetical protein
MQVYLCGWKSGIQKIYICGGRVRLQREKGITIPESTG